jgi:hypothetical protein
LSACGISGPSPSARTTTAARRDVASIDGTRTVAVRELVFIVDDARRITGAAVGDLARIIISEVRARSRAVTGGRARTNAERIDARWPLDKDTIVV